MLQDKHLSRIMVLEMKCMRRIARKTNRDRIQNKIMRDDTKRERGEKKKISYRKNEEISGWKAHINTRKINWNVLTIADVSLDQKRVCVKRETYIYSLLIEKDICDHKNVSVKLPCVYVCLSCGDHSMFLVRVSFSYFWVTHTSVLSFPHGIRDGNGQKKTEELLLKW